MQYRVGRNVHIEINPHGGLGLLLEHFSTIDHYPIWSAPISLKSE